MAKNTDAEGETQGEGRNNGPRSDTGAPDEIEATGDAIIISSAIGDLADSFRELARAIRSVLPGAPDDEEEKPSKGQYLDGTPIK